MAFRRQVVTCARTQAENPAAGLLIHPSMAFIGNKLNNSPTIIKTVYLNIFNNKWVHNITIILNSVFFNNKTLFSFKCIAI